MRNILPVALLCALLMPLPAALASEKPFRVTLRGDAFADGVWTTGVQIELDDGWKTYWRMPGDAGIPPQFTWTTSVPADVTVTYPVPDRFVDASGETVGYKHIVVFPVQVKAADATAVSLDLELFFAVCREVCIPADAKASIDLGNAMRDPEGSLSVTEWQARTSSPGTPVSAASIDATGPKPVLKLELREAAEDIFVETGTSAYFRAPRFSADGREADLEIDNIKDVAKLGGAVLTVTAVAGGKGLEQQVTLP